MIKSTRLRQIGPLVLLLGRITSGRGRKEEGTRRTGRMAARDLARTEKLCRIVAITVIASVASRQMQLMLCTVFLNMPTCRPFIDCCAKCTQWIVCSWGTRAGAAHTHKCRESRDNLIELANINTPICSPFIYRNGQSIMLEKVHQRRE